MQVFTDLDSTWTTGDSIAPQPINNFYQPSGQQIFVLESATYYCLDFNIESSNQKQFFDLTNSERSNGLLLNANFRGDYLTKVLLGKTQISQAYLQYVSC